MIRPHVPRPSESNTLHYGNPIPIMQGMIPRRQLAEAVMKGLERAPAVALLGPRQCGKTTLARELAARHPGAVRVFDLEHPADEAALRNPLLAIERLRGLVVIDEVQRLPELYPVLRVLLDRPGTPARFLLLGSASPHLVRGVTESLAGRVAFVDMQGFSLDDVGLVAERMLWLRGGFPRRTTGRASPGEMIFFAASASGISAPLA